MNRRVRFVLHGNFQLGFLLTLICLVGAGLAAGAVMQYRAAEALIKAATFSAHLTVSSSGELLWRAIARVSLSAAAASILAGGAAIFFGLFYLERLLRSLVEGVGHLSQGRVTFRLKARRGWGRSLITEFNQSAERLEQRASILRALLGACQNAAASGRPDALEELARLQEELRSASAFI